VRGEETSFWEISVISCDVTSSTAFRKSSKGFLNMANVAGKQKIIQL
jgi:hypothetical protein